MCKVFEKLSRRIVDVVVVEESRLVAMVARMRLE